MSSLLNKNHGIVSVKNRQKITDIKKSKNAKVYQKSINCSIKNDVSKISIFLKLCKDNISERFQEINIHSFEDLAHSSKIFFKF